jgi:uncharacterized SAM-binding protein YcdF (DUF218 family)
VLLTPAVAVFGWLLDGGGDYHAKGDVIVLLSGSTLETGIIGESSYWRAVFAVTAWREGGFRKIVVTGGSDPKAPIANLMADFLRANGIPPDAIVIESKADNTRENALNLKETLANLPGRKVLMTSDYHMFRALRTFRKVGIDVIPRPVRDVELRGKNPRSSWGAFMTVLTEFPKIPYYALRGWM